MNSIYVMLGYLIVLLLFAKGISLIKGAVRIVLFLILGAISLVVAYIVFGGFFEAIV